MSGFSNFELEQNLQAKTNELGNFLIDSTDNFLFTANNGKFLQPPGPGPVQFSSDYFIYPTYHINQQSTYPMLNKSMMYYAPPSSLQYRNSKNYAPFVTNFTPSMNFTNNYDVSQSTAVESICVQPNVYDIKSIQQYPQQIPNTTMSNLSLNAALTSQIPRPVKEFNKGFYQQKKLFPNDKKLIKYNKNSVVKDKLRELSPIIVSLEKLRIGPGFPNPSELFAILSLFRQLSHYTIQMCKERRSLETLYLSNVTGYIPDSNYLPAVIKDISNHIKLTKQAIGHEFYEIKKLIDSIKICQYGNINELNNKFQTEIFNLEKYEHIPIKHKNGMLLLSNDKIVGLKIILTNIIEYVRLYTVYVTTLKYKISTERKIVSSGKVYRQNGRQELRRIGV